MKSFGRLFSFGKSLWKYYVAVSFFTVLLAILNQLYPIFTKGAIDQITNLSSGHAANLKVVVIFVITILLQYVTRLHTVNVPSIITLLWKCATP